MLAEADGVTAVSLGVPVGLDVGARPAEPVTVARRLLQGEDIHAEVVPPFGLVALERGRRFAIQQDWLGMCRLFTGESGGVTVFSSRPSLVARFLGTPETPDYDGWASYAACGHFGGESSPVHGVRLLGPGQRVSGWRRDDGGWELTTQTRFGVDDVISAGIAARGGGAAKALDMAAHGLTSTGSSVDALYDAPITLGLSGGRDSRLIAASLIASGRLPNFLTNDDTAAEGETARMLVEILRDKRGLQPSHRVVPASTQAVVQNMGLRDRVLRLQALHDYQFPSTYMVRFPGRAQFPLDARPVSFTGAGGEVATGYWYPKHHSKRHDTERFGRSDALSTVMEHLLASGCGRPAVAKGVIAQETARVSGLLDRGEALGLRGLELVDLMYLVERGRRWSSSAYFVGMVTPYLSPGFVAASFAASPEQKRDRLLHAGLLERFLPEWAHVPYVSVSTGTSTAARIWDGDGLEVLHGLLDTVHGRLTNLLRRDAVSAALVDGVGRAGTFTSQKVLQQFASLAIAAESLEPDSIRPATASYSAFFRSIANRSTSALPAPPPWIAARLKFVRNTRLGRWAWNGLRLVVIRVRHRGLARAAQRPTSLLLGRWRNRSGAR